MALTHDRHHVYWPRRDYATPLEKRFRSLPCNIVALPVAEHRRLHATMPPPEKPDVMDMKALVELHRLKLCLVCFEATDRK